MEKAWRATKKFCFFCLALASALAFSSERFPEHPDPLLTPGSLCTNASARRYAEKIVYCNRSVSKSTKDQVIEKYDETLSYQVRAMNRAEFKIDHYIPLCMGGSNDKANLWPQHRTIYVITDPIEQAACEKMAKGRLLQAEAVELVKRAKADLDAANEILRGLRDDRDH